MYMYVCGHCVVQHKRKNEILNKVVQLLQYHLTIDMRVKITCKMPSVSQYYVISNCLHKYWSVIGQNAIT